MSEESHLNFRIVVGDLEKVPLFSKLSSDRKALEALSKVLRVQSFQPGDRMIEENQAGDEAFILFEGTAAVWKKTLEGDRYKMAILQGKDFPVFGEGALIAADERSATIQAETPCQCFVFHRKAFEQLGADHPEWTMPILHEVARTLMSRLRNTSRDFALLYHALVEEIRGTEISTGLR